MKATRANDTGPGAVALVEEAVHLLRGAPAAAWAIYLAGATPWLLALAWFWAASSWFAPRPAETLWHALGLAVLYVWLKAAQAAFCARLRAMRLDAAPPRLGLRALLRIAARQARLQGWAVPVLPVAALLTVPAGMAWMFFENATALAATEDAPGETLATRAWREPRRWPRPAHRALLLFSGLWLCVWVNIATAFYIIPWFARTLLGIENLFALSGWSALNSTFLALVTALTWLAVDPLVKACHVLRTFYGEARLTGEDLRLEIRRPRPAGGARAALVALSLLVMPGDGTPTGGLRAEATPSVAATSATPDEIDAALDAALRGREFLWRLEPLPEPGTETTGDGPVKSFVRAGVDIFKQVIEDVGDFFRKVKEWWDGLFRDKEKKREYKPSTREPRDYRALARGLLYCLLGLCFVVLLWILWVGWRQRARPPARLLAAAPSAPLPPDLNDEKLEASRLPSDEWLALAREQMARGEWRLALRALYLATLAGLGERGLVTLARAKTNLDYERELVRRAAGREELVAAFRGRRLAFERVWYGRELAAEPEVRAWLAELERDREGAA